MLILHNISCLQIISIHLTQNRHCQRTVNILCAFYVMELSVRRFVYECDAHTDVWWLIMYILAARHCHWSTIQYRDRCQTNEIQSFNCKPTNMLNHEFTHRAKAVDWLANCGPPTQTCYWSTVDAMYCMLELKFRQYPAIHTNYSWPNCTISN